jgi:hypothetical protein
MMNALFGDRGRPLYGQAVPEELGPLDPADLADYVADRFARRRRAADDVLGALVATAQGHPQRAMLLAHHLFAQTPAGGRADAATWQAALASTMAELDGEFREYWRGRTVGEQRVLRAIVAFGSPYAGAAARLGLKSSSAAGAVERLRAGGDLWPDGFRLTDPLLAGWIERFDRTTVRSSPSPADAMATATRSRPEALESVSDGVMQTRYTGGPVRCPEGGRTAIHRSDAGHPARGAPRADERQILSRLPVGVDPWRRRSVRSLMRSARLPCCTTREPRRPAERRRRALHGLHHGGARGAAVLAGGRRSRARRPVPAPVRAPRRPRAAGRLRDLVDAP